MTIRFGGSGGLAVRAVMAAVAAALVAGCNSLVPGSGGLTSQPTDSNVIGYFMPATMAQVTSGTTFQQTLATLEKEQFEACIRRLGFNSQAQTLAFAELNFMPFATAAAYQRAQEAGLGLVNLQSIQQSGMLAPIYYQGLNQPNLSGISMAELRAIEADRWRCWSQAQQPARQLNLLGAALFRQWYAVQSRVEASAQVQALDKVFGTCVMKSGAPRTAAGSLRQFINWLEGVINRGAFIIVQRGAGSPGFSSSSSALGNTDAQWTAVFARCAGPLVAVLQGLWLEKQQAFMQTHFQQVTQLEKVAAQTLSTLARMSQQQ
jgi:hypothetical protein